ncbi:MAG TPA: HAD family phosphatase [Candidatus Baltobacteraceae bacterium]|nr:HAD family phosphatase [Candidatus Sulfotelmatobacter sp.]HTV76263.1 HAD family phosphatase [Candidatus Baltobacteraceae bacterium]
MDPVVVFDLGKVLVDFDYSIAAKKVAARSSRPVERLDKFLSGSPLLNQFESGLLSSREFFSEVRDITGFDGTAQEFADFFADIFAPMPDMIRLHAGLRKKNIPTYIFSNTNEIAVGHIRRNFPFFEGFDGYILSYEIGAMKPQAKIYEALESMTRRRGADIFYIDDRAENVEAGAARGWQIVLHETPEKTEMELERFLTNSR